MKLAKLYDGTQLAFPPETPDEEMHARVKEHTARLRSAEQTPPAAIEPSGQIEEQQQGPDISGFLTLLQAVMSDREQKEMSSREKEQADREFRESEVERKNNATLGMRESVTLAADKIGQSVTDSLQPLVETVAKNSDRIDDVVKAIDKLSKAISSSAQLIVETMRMPKEIGFDANGKPKSVKIK